MDTFMINPPPHNGFVFVICAPSGTGKTTLAQRLLNEFPNLSYSVSCTTRPPRQGEVNGKDYHFISQADFIARRDQGDFIEWAKDEIHEDWCVIKALERGYVIHNGQMSLGTRMFQLSLYENNDT